MTDQDKPDQSVDDDATDAPQADPQREANATTDTAQTADAESESASASDADPANAPEAAPEDDASDADLDLWAEAMAEQQSQETAEDEPQEEASQESDANSEEDDLWAAAMAEQTQDEPDQASAPARQQATRSATDTETASEQLFRPFEQSNANGESRDMAMILDIPVQLSVELGRTKVTIKQLLEMAQGSVVELDGLAGEPMDILINGYLIAQGEVVVVEDKYGIRITEIVSPSERVQKLNR